LFGLLGKLGGRPGRQFLLKTWLFIALRTKSPATGFKRSYVSSLEEGKIKHPRIHTVDKIAKAFGMKLSEFIIYCEKLHSDFPSSST
jgi:transcriptional regulator with XRE-family HTH domain